MRLASFLWLLVRIFTDRLTCLRMAKRHLGSLRKICAGLICAKIAWGGVVALALARGMT